MWDIDFGKAMVFLFVLGIGAGVLIAGVVAGLVLLVCWLL